MDKTFFIGIGAAKSGTSWVYQYLASHPDVAPSPIKEMHVLNSQGNNGLLEAIQFLPWHRFAGRKWLYENLQKAWYRADWNRYFNFYENVLHKGACATGEISTSYMTISSETLTMVRERFADQGVRTVGMLFLRDPVERLISEAKFRRRLSQENRYTDTLNEPLDSIILDKLKNRTGAGRTTYDTALRNLTETFEPDHLYVGLYEKLFSQDTIAEICGRLHLPAHSASFEMKVNATPSSEPIEASVITRAREALSNDYLAAEAFFGRAKLGDSWKYF